MSREQLNVCFSSTMYHGSWRHGQKIFTLDHPIDIHTGWVFAPFGIKKSIVGVFSNVKESGSVTLSLQVNHPLCTMLDSYDATLQANFMTNLPVSMMPWIQPKLESFPTHLWEIKLSKSLFQQIKHWSPEHLQPRWLQCQVRLYGYSRFGRRISNLYHVKEVQLGPTNPDSKPLSPIPFQPYCFHCRQQFSIVLQFIIPEMAWIIMTFLNPLDIQPIKETIDSQSEKDCFLPEES